MISVEIVERIFNFSGQHSTRLDSAGLGSARGESFSRDRIRARRASDLITRAFAELVLSEFSRNLGRPTYSPYPRSYRVISDRCNCTRDACAPTVDLSRDVSLRVTTTHYPLPD